MLYNDPALAEPCSLLCVGLAGAHMLVNTRDWLRKILRSSRKGAGFSFYFLDDEERSGRRDRSANHRHCTKWMRGCWPLGVRTLASLAVDFLSQQ